jgi:hypothetical protein
MNEPRKFRKKPVVVEAMLYESTTFSRNQIIYWMESHLALSRGTAYQIDVDSGEFFILTLEGRMKVAHGDYIIRGVQGEFYPCKPDIFNATYEEAS